MNSLRITYILTVLLLAACSQSFEVSDVQFGSFTGVGTTSITFRAESSISRRRDVPIGWAFSIRNPPESLTIHEVIEGPAGANWEAPPNAPGVELSEGGRIASVTKTISKPSSPLLFHHWTISDSDPIGKYRASFYIDGKLVKRVDFDVTN